MSGGTTTTTNNNSTQANEIPQWMTDAGQQNYAFAQQVAEQPLQQYQGQMVADVSPQTQQSWDVAANFGERGRRPVQRRDDRLSRRAGAAACRSQRRRPDDAGRLRRPDDASRRRRPRRCRSPTPAPATQTR